MQQQPTSRAEAERLLGIAEKLLQSKDLAGSKDFAVLAQETEPLLDGSDQILAVVDVLIAADKRINNHLDWYAILQLDRRYDDLEQIKHQYRRLALVLHPDKNKFPFADAAFKLVADAWAVLSDPSKKASYDNEFSMFSRVDLVPTMRKSQLEKGEKLPVRKGSNPTPPAARTANLWTACPYCYNLYEYLRSYEGCCLRCQNCQRAFQAVEIPSLPPTVPGKDAYYCCWAFFPMGFAMSNSDGPVKGKSMPNWMPPMFPTMGTAWPSAASIPNGGGVTTESEGYVDVPHPHPPPPQPPQQHHHHQRQPQPQRNPNPMVPGSGQRKRGRPRKNLM